MERVLVLLLLLMCLSILFVTLHSSTLTCPVDCNNVNCVSDLTQEDCDLLTKSSGSTTQAYVLLNNVSYCNCCPGCKQYAVRSSACSKTNRCKPGLKCSTKSLCILDKTTCEYKRTSSLVLWKSTCEVGGTYGSRQCKGELPTGRCFCSNSTGGRLFGQEWWTKADNMTCACSRRVWELKNTNRQNVTLHCDQHGNYEELQCDSSLCWCVEPQTGQPTSVVVPDILMPQLPCYNSTAVGYQYLRQCESQYVAVINIREELKYHGTTMDSMLTLRCDNDGSYSAVQVSSTVAYCRSRNNTLLSGQSQISDLSSMDCNCARDQLYYPESGMGTLPLSCKVNGNYDNPQYDTEQKGYCVDSDGYILRYLTDDDYVNSDYYGKDLCT